MVQGKQKGNSFENKVLLMLRKRYGYDSCSKTVGSGNSKDDKGDLIFTPGSSRHMLELKHHRMLSWKQLLAFYRKVKGEADKMSEEFDNKIEPAVVYRENRKPLMIMYERNIICVSLFEEWLNSVVD